MRKILLSLVFLSLTFLARSQNNDNLLAKQLVISNAAAIGLSPADLDNYFVSSSYFNQTGGTQMVYLLQGYKGLPVWNQMLVLAFKNGALISKAGSFLSTDKLANTGSASPSTTAVDAVRAACTESAIAAPSFMVPVSSKENGRIIDFGKLNIATENVTAELMWVPVMNGTVMTGVKLAWQVQLFPTTSSDYWNIRVDATNNTVINKNNLTVYEKIMRNETMNDETGSAERRQLLENMIRKSLNPAPATNWSFTSSGKDLNENSPSLVGTANYLVIPYPAESPIHPGGTAAVRTNPWTLAGGNAVSLGWHNDGTTDYTVSRGNNVYAQEDRDNNNNTFGLTANSTTTPDPLNFNFPPNYTVDPTNAAFQQFALTNLFYWNNLLHDLTYKYGFDEVGGNFQNSNQGRGGAGNDYVIADGQDAGGTNNANFGTPVDGNRPRMQMYLWSPARGVLTFVVNAPPVIAGPYNAVEGAMSTNNLLGNVGPRTGQLVYYNDDAGGTTHEGCAAPANSVSGKIALINRGTCAFAVKVKNAQDAGAIGVVMVNNAPGPPIVMGGADNTIIIPAIMISDVDGATIAAQLASNVNVTMSATTPGTVNLDGDIDNGIIAHEFFHGVSNRLTGGPANTSCLGNAEEGGEGWSDYNALMITTDWSTALATDGNNVPRPMGNYAFGYSVNGPGIRLYPYCTNMAVNPLTYASMGVAPVGTEVHNIGEIMCMTLWEVTWALIQTDGINPNLFNSAGVGGNTVAYKLMMEGLKLQPCSPGYIDARNAILQADQNLYGGAHLCALWTAFAKRGMGFSASQGSAFSATDQVAAFDLPPGTNITGQPANTTACVGTSTSFTIVATGTSLTYQWQLSTAGAGGPWTNITNVAPYSGATTPTLAINPIALTMNNYRYRCVVTGATGTCTVVTSNNALLTVIPTAVGGTITPANTTLCVTPNTGVLTLAGYVGPISQWEFSTNSGASWTPIANTTTTYTYNNVTVTTWYRVLISAAGCAPAYSSIAIITVLPGGGPIYIQAVPGSTLCQGDPAALTVRVGTASPIGTLYTQTGTAGGSPNSQAFEAANVGFNNQAAEDFVVPAGATWTISQVSANGLYFNGAGPSASFNVFFYSNAATNIPGTLIASYTNLGYTGGASPVITIPNTILAAGTYWVSIQSNMSFAVGGQWAWGAAGTTAIGNPWAWQNPNGGFGVCPTWGAGSTTCVPGTGANLLFTLTGTTLTDGGPLPPGYTFLWSPAAGLSSTTTNPVAASPATTTTYTVAVNDGVGCTRNASILITVNLRPTVTSQPANATSCVGSPATFTVGATGTALTYQWQVSTTGCAGPWTNLTNTAPYSGVNGPTLNITSVTAAMNNNQYRCVLGGTCSPVGTANISNCAALSVNALPTVTITPATGCGGTPGNGLLLSTGNFAPPTPGTVTATSGTINLPVPDNTANGVSNNINIAGVPANATITNITVTLNMSHTYPGDMIFNLKSPAGQILNLYKYGTGAFTGPASGVPTWGWYGAKVSQSGNIAWSSVSAPPFIYNSTTNWKADAIDLPVPGQAIQNPAGFVSNAANFQALYTTGASTNGAWTLAMCDGGGGDVGSLASWTITVDYTTPPPGSPITFTWSPAAGLWMDQATTIPYTLGTQTAQVYAAPTAFTIYTATANDGSTGCRATATALINYTPPAPTITPSAVAMCLGDAAVKLKSSSTQPFSSTFNSGTLALAVPDGPATWPQTVFPGVSTPNLAVSGIPAGATITGMSVKLNLTQTAISDMVIVLKGPNGQVLNLDANINRTGVAGANFVNTIISSASTNPLSNGTAPFSSTFQPDAVGATYTALGFTFPGGPTSPAGYIPTVSSFSGLYSVPNGNWTLGLYDWGAGDLGILTNWELKIDYVVGVPATPAVWNPPAGLFSDAGASTPYVAGTAVDSVWAKPTPSGVYPYTATVQSLPVPPIVFSNPAPITINDASTGTPYPANLVVSGLPTTGVAVKNVTLANMNHTWTSDIDIVLQNPAGTQNVILLSDVGGANDLAATTLIFDDAAAAVVPGTVTPIPSGTYKPTNVGTPDTWPAPGPGTLTQPTPTLATFTGNMNGTWKLFVVDQFAGDVGNINGGYSIGFALTSPPCTSPAKTVVVTVNTPTTVLTQPVNQAVCTDKVATFTVAASGTGPFSYQWQVSTNNGNTFTNIANGGVYAGATTATLTITAPPVTMSGYFYRAVINGAAPCASATSFQVTLTVNPLPTIVISASPYTSIFPGLSTTLSSVVTPNAAAQYAWLLNGVPVTGANSATLLVTASGLGDYTLRVTDSKGCTNTSNVITIKDSASGKCFIYPNPNSGQFQVRYYSVANNSPLPRTLTIYDAKGTRVMTQYYTIGRPYDRMDVDMRKYGKGLYWVEIGDMNGSRLTMCRIVIE